MHNYNAVAILHTLLLTMALGKSLQQFSGSGSWQNPLFTSLLAVYHFTANSWLRLTHDGE
jgi:hypothetical protein